MFKTLARSVALGVLAAGAILAGSGIASADPVAGPGDLTYCPPGYHTANDAIQIPGVPKGCEPSIPVVRVPSAVIDAGQPDNPTDAAAGGKFFIADSFGFGVER